MPDTRRDLQRAYYLLLFRQLSSRLGNDFVFLNSFGHQLGMLVARIAHLLFERRSRVLRWVWHRSRDIRSTLDTCPIGCNAQSQRKQYRCCEGHPDFLPANLGWLIREPLPAIPTNSFIAGRCLLAPCVFVQPLKESF